MNVQASVEVLFAGIGMTLGIYLIVRGQQYKDEMSRLDHPFGDWPTWMIRLLGVFMVAFSLGFIFLALRSSIN